MITMQAIQIMVISGSGSKRIYFMCYEIAESCYICSSSFGKLFFKGPQTLVIKGAWIDYGT